MSATPPEANTEYSTSPAPIRPVSRRRGRVREGPARPPVATAPRALRAGVLTGGLTGALLLLVAEFTTLFDVQVATSTTPLRSVSTASHDAYALVPIALLAGFLAYAVWRASSRPAMLALGLLGLIALAIGLLGDLPDAHASGLVLQSSHYVSASSTPGVGFYLETLGAIVLLITCVSGFLMIGAPARLARSS